MVDTRQPQIKNVRVSANVGCYSILGDGQSRRLSVELWTQGADGTASSVAYIHAGIVVSLEHDLGDRFVELKDTDVAEALDLLTEILSRSMFHSRRQELTEKIEAIRAHLPAIQVFVWQRRVQTLQEDLEEAQRNLVWAQSQITEDIDARHD